MGYKGDDPCLDTADDDELIFVLLGRDPMGAVGAVIWAALSEDCQPDGQIIKAERHAERMSDYCELRNPGRWDERLTIESIDRAKGTLDTLRRALVRKSANS